MKKAFPLFLVLLSMLLWAQSENNPHQQPLALVHVTLLDVAGGSTQPNMSILVTGARITEVGKADQVLVPAGAVVVNAEGRFLIPGLWDMHVHWYDKRTLSLFTANGITGIREMFGNSELLRWRQELADGSLLGPRMIVASPILDGPRPMWPIPFPWTTRPKGEKPSSRSKNGSRTS